MRGVLACHNGCDQGEPYPLPNVCFFLEGGVVTPALAASFYNDCPTPTQCVAGMLTRVLRSRYVFEKDKQGGENLSPANMTVRDAALFGANRDNFQRVRKFWTSKATKGSSSPAGPPSATAGASLRRRSVLGVKPHNVSTTPKAVTTTRGSPGAASSGRRSGGSSGRRGSPATAAAASSPLGVCTAAATPTTGAGASPGLIHASVASFGGSAAARRVSPLASAAGSPSLSHGAVTPQQPPTAAPRSSCSSTGRKIEALKVNIRTLRQQLRQSQAQLQQELRSACGLLGVGSPRPLQTPAGAQVRTPPGPNSTCSRGTSGSNASGGSGRGRRLRGCRVRLAVNIGGAGGGGEGDREAGRSSSRRRRGRPSQRC